MFLGKQTKCYTNLSTDMKDTIRFTKMHGAGNDYIYVNTLLYSIPDPEKEAIKWSAPHTGIGSDGLVLIGRPSDKEKADFSMRIFNADGSEAMMCGNASRCIGKYLYEKGLVNGDTVRLETKSGVKVLHLHIKEDKVDSVTVDMLEPAFNAAAQWTGEQPAALAEELPFKVVDTMFVSMGNPHFVVFVDDISLVDVALEGRKMEFDPVFPERCNIEFAQPVAPSTLRTRVWERGSGITMACGTGACATAVAAFKKGISWRSTDIMMDGGTLHIEYSEADGHVYLSGPAAFVFEGETEL